MCEVFESFMLRTNCRWNQWHNQTFSLRTEQKLPNGRRHEQHKEDWTKYKLWAIHIMTALTVYIPLLKENRQILMTFQYEGIQGGKYINYVDWWMLWTWLIFLKWRGGRCWCTWCRSTGWARKWTDCERGWEEVKKRKNKQKSSDGKTMRAFRNAKIT